MKLVSDEIDDGLESIVTENKEEGKKIAYYTTRYERSAINRRNAIKYHGTVCQGCGFDFEKVYGKRGKGFIEVHHIKPLYEKNEIVEINPKTDLLCVCANCHRMIHAKRDTILTLDQLKKCIKDNT